MTATAKKIEESAAVSVTKANPAVPAFVVTGAGSIAVRAGTTFEVAGRTHAFAEETVVAMPVLDAGADYVILIGVNGPEAMPYINAKPDGDALGGFHYAPGGNADDRRQGGDEVPAINPHSIWDVAFRPACADPRGMALVVAPHGLFWCDIYLCGPRPYEFGTSVFGQTIADGDDLPFDSKGKKLKAFDHPTATQIYADAGKTLLSPEDFFHAALGVTEATSAEDDPETTGLDAARTSRWGVMQATGNMSTWGHDGDPDPAKRRACRFGGHWGNGGWAGSRCASVGYWPDDSGEWIGARGRSDHLNLA